MWNVAGFVVIAFAGTTAAKKLRTQLRETRAGLEQRAGGQGAKLGQADKKPPADGPCGKGHEAGRTVPACDELERAS